MVEGVLFDMDGLMLDTQKVWDATIDSTADELGVEVPEGFHDAVRGCSGEALIEVCRRFFGTDVDVRAYIAKIWDNADAAFEKGVDKKPGLDELLAWLKGRGIPAAVASGSKMNQIMHHVEMVGLEDWFEAFISGFDVPRAKPYPDIFLAAAERLGTDPSRTIVLEDSVNGIVAAHAGGFIPIMVPDRDAPTEEIVAMCAAVCDTLADVIPLIEGGL